MGKTQKRGRGNGLTVDLLLVAGSAYTTVTSIETKVCSTSKCLGLGY